MNDITGALKTRIMGHDRSGELLLAAVYDELRSLARAKMAREPAGQTLQPTALVHEAWMRLGKNQPQDWENRAHFFAAAAEAMRRILIERARRRMARRNGGGLERTGLADLDVAIASEDDRLLAVNEALEKLTLAHPAKAQLVKLRYFSGLTISEAALTLQVSEPTANRWWAYSRAWLLDELRKSCIKNIQTS